MREVEQSGVQVQVGFMRRFDPALQALRGLIVGGELGRVHTLQVASHDHEPPGEEYVARSGGMFRDQLIHDFDMIRWVTASEVQSVYAAGAVRTIDFAEKYGDVDTCALVLQLADGAFVLLAGTREDGRGEDVRIEVVGSLDSAERRAQRPHAAAVSRPDRRRDRSSAVPRRVRSVRRGLRRRGRPLPRRGGR